MIHIRPMAAADIPLGMRLKQQAGWNQTEADWARFLDLEPEGCFVAELDAAAVGTVTTCLFGRVAWVAMVLVDVAVRGRGVGKALMRHALDFLDGQGVRKVRLDATPLGQPLYEKLGFVPEYQLARYEGILPPSPPPAGVTQAMPQQVESLVQLDREATATDRGKLLRRLFAERPEAVRLVEREGRPGGFLTVRPGARALLIGPCIAMAEAGSLLFRDACHRYAGQAVFIDIPTPNAAAGRMAQAWGLTVQRPLVRMSRGDKMADLVENIWASSGPEKG